jgi:hypothetical protein
MKATQRAGRNDPCPCGSGKKFKRCCEHKFGAAGSGNSLTIIAIISVLVMAAVFAINIFTRDSAPAGSRQVWSPEHGHYHTVP